MSLITIFDYFKQPMDSKPLVNILHQIKSGRYKIMIDQLRTFFQKDLDAEFDAQKRIMPRFSVAGNFTYQIDKLKLDNYTGLLVLEIPFLNEKDLKSVREVLVADPFVCACFLNALGNGLVFIVGSSEDQKQHRKMFRFAVNYYQKLTGVKRFSKDGLAIDHTIMFSSDIDAYIDLRAIPLSSNLQKVASS